MRSLLSVSGGTLVSRVLGLIREMAIAWTFGANAATDAFWVAFRIPNFMRRLFAEGSFYWFLMQEFNRYQRTKLGFGIVLLSPCASLDQNLGLNHSRQEVIAWLGKVAVAEVRKLDYICHFKGLIGMVLANSTLEESETCAQRIIEIANNRNNSERFEAGFKPYAGVAGMPQTCEHPGILIAAAQQSLNQAMATNVPVLAFR